MSRLSNTAGLIANGAVELFTEVTAPAEQFGVPILLLSEAEAPSSRWPEALIDGLVSAGSAVIRFDTRDIGRSSWVDEPYTMADLAGDALAILEDLGVRRAHLVGRSMGGIVAQHLALDSPERVAGLTLVSSTPGRRDEYGLPEDWLIEAMSERLFADLPVGVVARVEWVIDQLEWFSGPLVDFDRRAAARDVYAEVSEMWRGPNGHGLAVVEAPDRFDELRAITAPSVVIHGTADPVYPVGHGQALAEQIPNARLQLIEGLGHELPNGFVPQLLQILTAFQDTIH